MMGQQSLVWHVPMVEWVMEHYVVQQVDMMMVVVPSLLPPHQVLVHAQVIDHDVAYPLFVANAMILKQSVKSTTDQTRPVTRNEMETESVNIKANIPKRNHVELNEQYTGTDMR
jgi:hypothetical protein